MEDYKDFNYMMYQYTDPLYRQNSKKQKKNNKRKEYTGYERWKPCVIHQKKTCRHITAKEVLRKANKRSVFFSQYRFCEDTKTFKPKDNKAHIALKWGDLIMESDKGDVIEYSRMMFNYLTIELNIPAEYISLSYSGSRSIHIEISAWVFGYEPSMDLPELQKHIVRILAERTGTIDKWDTGIYYPKRVFRAMNSHRADKGTWKIPINPDELFNLSMEDLKILASQGPRKDSPLINVIGEPIEKARQITIEARQKLSDSLKTEKVIQETKPFPNINADRLRMNGQPSCIQYLIEKGNTEGLRNSSSMFHGTFCKDSGMAIEDAEEEISIWHTRIPSKHSPEERERQLKDVLSTIYSGDYSFYCKNLADKLYLPCNSKCPVYPRKQKTIEVPAMEKTISNSLSLLQARKQMAIIIKNCLDQEGNYLIQATPGTGKTKITLQIATEKSINTDKRFIYVHGFINQLEELQKTGHMPASHWTIIYARKQIKGFYNEGEKTGNCYYADTINNLIYNLRQPANNVIKAVCRKCGYKEICKDNEKMYIGQWNTKKNLAMTHKMYTLAVGPEKHEPEIYKVIIDEDIHKEAFNTVKVSRRYISSINDSHPLVMALERIIIEMEALGENAYLTGETLLTKLKQHSNMTMEALLSNPMSDRVNEFHWKEDLYNILLEEYKYYNIYGKDYMSRVHLYYYKKHQNIDFYFYIKRPLPLYDTLALDATTPAIVWEKVLDRPIQLHQFHVTQPSGMEIIQVNSGKYGKNAHNDKKLLNKEEEIVSLIKSKTTDDVFIAGWKGTNEHLSRNFYNLRGTNAYEESDIAVILGTSNIRPTTLKEITTAIFYDEKPVVFETIMEPIPYGMNNDGKDFAYKTLKATDHRYDAIWSIYQDAEIFQAINRIRPFVKDRSKIYLITSLPIRWLIPTELLTMNELIISLKRSSNILYNSGNREYVSMTEEQINQINNTLWYYSKWEYIVNRSLQQRTCIADAVRTSAVYKSSNKHTHNALSLSDSAESDGAGVYNNIVDLYTMQTGSTQSIDVRHEVLSHSEWYNMTKSQKRYKFNQFINNYNLNKKQYKSHHFKGNKLTVYHNEGAEPFLNDVVKDYTNFCSKQLQQ